MYSLPREDDVEEYTHVEVGYPNGKPQFFAEYAEREEYTETIYPYVPVALVEQEIAFHGGLKLSERQALIQHANETLFKGKDILK